MIDSEDLKEGILDGGPIFIMGRIFMVQKWPLGLEE